MARPIRLEFQGALYYVTARGGRRDDIYKNDADRKSFGYIRDSQEAKLLIDSGA